MASYLEKYIGEVIKFRLPGATGPLKKKMFGNEGLLGPAVAKFDLAKALSCIDNEMHNDLKVIASIRNQFAHNIDVDSFEHPEIAKRINNLKIRPRRPNENKVMDEWNDWDNAAKFKFVAATLVSSIFNTLHRVSKMIKDGGNG